MLRLSTESLSSLLLSLSLATGPACGPLGTLDHHHHHVMHTDCPMDWRAGWLAGVGALWMIDGWMMDGSQCVAQHCLPYSLSSLESPVSPAPKSSCRLSPSVPSIRLVLRSASAR